MSRCEGERTIREDEKMGKGCADEKMICAGVKMRRREDEKMKFVVCVDVKMTKC